MFVLPFITMLVFLFPAVLLTQCCKKKTKNEDKDVNQPLDAGKNAKSKAKGGGKKPSAPSETNEAKKVVKAAIQPPTSTAAGPSSETALSKKEKPKSKTNILSTKTAAVKPKVGAQTALPKSALPKGQNAATAFTLEKSADKTKIIPGEIGKPKVKPEVSPVNATSKTEDATQTLIMAPSADMMSVAAMTANPETLEKKSGNKSKDGQKTSSFYDLDTTNKTSDSLYENVDLPKSKSNIEKEKEKEDEDDEDTERSIMKNKLDDEKKKKMAAPDEYQTLANMSIEKVFKKVG